MSTQSLGSLGSDFPPPDYQAQLETAAERSVQTAAKLAASQNYIYSQPYMGYGHNLLFEALTKAQSKFTTVAKTKDIDRGPGKKPFKYADLADVLEMALPILSVHGLGIIQKIRVSDKGPRLVTKIIHLSGQSDEDDGVKLQEDQTNQIFGTSLTYARRYGACAMLGIVSDEDTDGAEEKDKVHLTSAAAPRILRTMPSPTPTPTPPPAAPAAADEVTTEIKRGYSARITAAGKKLDDGLIFVRNHAGVSDTRGLGRQQFDAAMFALESAVKLGTFDEIVKQAQEKK